jgi:anaerobic sulfite reductase subunit B
VSVTLGPMVPEARVVVDRRWETADTVTLTLAPRGETDAVAPRPGQFLMLSAFGVGEVPISVSGLGRPGGAVEHTIRSVGAVTAALTGAPVGEVLGVRGPFGRGWDLDAAVGRDVVLVAGGIGLAPLRPVAEAVLAEPERFGRLHVLVGARTPGDLCFAEDLRRWAEQGAHVAATVDRLEGPGADAWTGPVGVVTTLIGPTPFDPARIAAFVCGPEVMMRFALRALAGRGIEAAEVQVSAERSMSCGIGHCGRCQLGPLLICRDGPVLPAGELLELMAVKQR